MPRIRTITTMTELSAAITAAFNAINAHYYDNELENHIRERKSRGKSWKITK